MRRCAVGGLLLAFVGAQAAIGASRAPATAEHPMRVAFAGYAGVSETADVFVVDSDGSNARDLTPRHGGGSPAWSPNGRQLAFVRLSGLWIMNADGSDQRILARARGLAFPTWSPDGRRIAFLLGRAKVWLAVVYANGTGFRKLAAADPSVVWPNGRLSWSPEGNWVAFTGGRSVRIVSVAGGEQRTLWHCTSSRTCVDPAWSPDGHHLLFSGDEGMMVVDDPRSSGERARVLIHNGYNQRWAPDGRTIVFEGDDVIYRMNADGSDRRRLVTGHNPVLSPDGRAIAFVRAKPNSGVSQWNVYESSIDGTGVRLLGTDSAVDYPAWSP